MLEIVYKHVKYDWKCLKTIICMSDERLLYFLSEVIIQIIEMGEKPREKHNFLSKALENRSLFETNFDTKIITPIYQ